jgi:hypothetical protein
MGWAAIITALLQMFGPALAEAMKRLLEKWLNRAADQMATNTFGDAQAASVALLDRTLAILPWYAVLKRAMVRRMKAAAARGGATDDDVAEMHELAHVAEFE